MPGDYEVGYKRPPADTRFRKGQSGNPKGRPKGAKNLKTELEEELLEKIVVREGQTRKEVSKQRAMIKGLMAKAMQGDARAATLVTNLVLRLLSADGPEGAEAELSDDDRSILKNYEDRILRADSPPEVTPDASRAKPQPSDGGAEREAS